MLRMIFVIVDILWEVFRVKVALSSRRVYFGIGERSLSIGGRMLVLRLFGGREGVSRGVWEERGESEKCREGEITGR